MADSYYENASHPRESHDSMRNSVNSNGDQSYNNSQQQQYDQSAHGRQSSETNGQSQYGNGYGGTPIKTEPGVTSVKNEYGAGGGSSAVKQSVKKALTSWVGFSNLPNQVHRRSVR
jgi:CubicO group peptidase (beta-lactamase class C family)